MNVTVNNCAEIPNETGFVPPDRPGLAPGPRIKPLWVGVAAAAVVLVAFLAVVIPHAGRHETGSASDFKHRTAFGGVDEQVSNRRSFGADRHHDTTATWSTKVVGADLWR